MQNEEAPWFSFKPDRAVAYGKPVLDGFLVRQGSTAVLNGSARVKRDREYRDDLINRGVLVADSNPDLLVFTSDHLFTSPSKAGGVVKDGNCSGNDAWKNDEIGMTVGDWLRATSRNEVDEEEVDRFHRPSNSNEEVAFMTPAPKNLILYGPPGTGKTYRTVEVAVALCDGSLPTGGREAVMKRYHELMDRKRIEFVTFHQSFSYEEFVEGLRPETGADEGEADAAGAGFRLVARPGIFKAIADRASANHGAAHEADYRGRNVFKMSLGRANDDEDAYLFKEAIDNGYVHLGYGGKLDWSDPKFNKFDAIKHAWQEHVGTDVDGNNPNVKQLYALRSWMREGDLVVVSDGNKEFRAVGEVIGPYKFVERNLDSYCQRRPVKWLWVGREGLGREVIYDKGFSQASIYRLDPELINWSSLNQIIAGGSAEKNRGMPESYVLIIDEINRANISKVFGELITLLEADKRIDQANRLTVKLPYSGKQFGVPSNLHIIGTMNTADRSIALLDTALRRRFQFEELMPKPELLSNDVDGINLRQLLQDINDRIEYLFDREHLIGHAYFMGCKTKAEVVEVLKDKIIPLLCEYFYEDRSKVAAALGDIPSSETGDFKGKFFERKRLTLAIAQVSDEDGGERFRWITKEEFDLSDYAA